MRGEVYTLGDLIRRQALVQGDRPALIHAGAVQSYAALDMCANRVGNALSRSGIRSGDRVAYLGQNDARFFELLFGAAKIGAVMVPVNWRLTTPEVAHILSDSGALVLVCDTDRHAIANAAATEPVPGIRILSLDADFDGWRDESSSSDPGVEVAADALAVLLYTSGTTGRPKGAMLPHGNFAMQRRNDAALGAWATWRPDDVNLVALPLFHVGGLGWALVGFHYGATNVIHAVPDPARILADIERQGITQMLLVPTVLQDMVRLSEPGDRRLSSVKTISYGAAPIAAPLLDSMIAAFGCGFAQLYGMTEATGTVSCLRPEDHGPHLVERMKSCGRALPLLHFSVRDANGTGLPPGTIGELYVRSPAIMSGYWNLPEATGAALTDGWYRTGDAGYLDGDGYFFIRDRIKDVIISGGENIYPAEVEQAICALDEVRECAVIGVPDAKWGETVKAFIVSEPGASLDAAELVERLRSRLAGYKLPRRMAFVDALPRNAAGKILKTELRKQAWAEMGRSVSRPSANA